MPDKRTGYGPYGKDWYRYENGVPPDDDDNSYIWNRISKRWERDWEYDDETQRINEDALEEYEERKRQRIAKQNEY